LALPQFTLVLGGASSGKSAFAESLCFKSTKTRIYIATAQAFDDEMRAKISDHRSQRGPDWLTIEAPLDVTSALATCTIGQIVLLDCATLWLSNVLLADQNIAAACASLLAALTTCPAHVIVVSNEVGHGIVPDNKLARQFRNAQGRLNQLLATQADLVVQVTAGLPQTLKGEAGLLT
jgi:adenosylcobinamide kinase/adenosylcobinamide-phosphate guanylyltransferase